MPLVDLPIAPGLVTERTERGAKGRWRDGNRVRFRQGQPEKLGGWLTRTLSGDTITGVPRAAIDWRAINGDAVTAVGTHLRLYQIFGSDAENITPYRLATDEYGGTDTELTDPFDTTDTSSTVDVTHATHGATVGDTVYFANATAVGGITIDGEYQITAVTDANTYQIVDDETASSTATGGGTVDYAYEINVGAKSGGAAGRGFGVGPFGEGTFGTARDAPSDILLPARTWALDTWGEDLIANPRNGSIYLWDKSAGYSDNRAALIHANAPAAAAFVIMSPVDRHLTAYGCTPSAGGDRDPLTIRWCAQNDYSDWTASRTNDAGERRLDHASEIISALRVREQTLIFTDISLCAQRSVRPPTTFSIRQLGSGCGLLGPMARAELGGVAFWMSYEDFFIFDGSLRVLPCPIRNHVFDDMNRAQVSKVHCGTNTTFQEVWWFYCSADSSEIDRYAVFAPLEQSWHFGELDRTAWLDQSSTRSTPAAFDADGAMYDHETGASADGSAMGEYIESGDVEIPGSGDQLMFVRKIVPDWLDLTGPMDVTLKARKYPEGEQVTRGPFTLQATTDYIRPRIRGRQVALRFESNQDSPETTWRMDTPRIDARPHGRR